MANAGENQSLVDADFSGHEIVTLDGSLSSDPDGTITLYRWTEGSTQIAEGVSATVGLDLGPHSIVLTAMDDDGASDTDTVMVTVRPVLADPPPDGASAVSTITEADLVDLVFALAHDSTRGRWTISPELEKAARWAAGLFEQFGLAAAGEDGYLQWFAPSAQEPAEALNVIALLPGSDPLRADEYVVIGAHFDHVGVGPPIAGDSIYNGADDNASGTSAVLELAEAFASLDEAPARSILFVLFSGEERGLLGSHHYVASSVAPMADVVAMINLDMIGRNWTDRVAAVYQPASDIFARSSAVAEAHPELDMDLLTDPWPGENLVNRSDQAAFIPYGIPVLFLTSGLHADYHRVTDEADRLDYDKTARLTRLVFWIGWEFAETAVPPGF